MTLDIESIIERATKDEEFAVQLRSSLMRQCLESQQVKETQLASEWNSFIKLFAARPQELFKLELVQIDNTSAKKNKKTTSTLSTLATLTSLTVIVATPTAVTTLTTLTTTTTTEK